jgi:hypothetical protein
MRREWIQARANGGARNHVVAKERHFLIPMEWM